MKKKIYLMSVLTALSCVVSACEDDESDTEKPVISLLEPAEGDLLQVGKTIHFEMDLSDNEMLDSYKVDIHTNFDGHTHSRATEDFTFSQSWDVSGKRNTTIHHHEIMIPADATPGKYHFMVYCTDASGNESYVAHSVTLTTEEVEDED